MKGNPGKQRRILTDNVNLSVIPCTLDAVFKNVLNCFRQPACIAPNYDAPGHVNLEIDAVQFYWNNKRAERSVYQAVCLDLPVLEHHNARIQTG